MLENITLGQIGTFVAYVFALGTGCSYIVKQVKKAFDNGLKPITERIDKIDKNTTMNFLVRCFGEIDRGIQLDEATKMRVYEQYGHYINDLKGNTYIHDTYERLKREGKL